MHQHGFTPALFGHACIQRLFFSCPLLPVRDLVVEILIFLWNCGWQRCFCVSMCLCVRGCDCLSVCVRDCVYMRLRVHVCVPVSVSVSACTCASVGVHACAHARVYMHMFVRASVRARLCVVSFRRQPRSWRRRSSKLTTPTASSTTAVAPAPMHTPRRKCAKRHTRRRRRRRRTRAVPRQWTNLPKWVLMFRRPWGNSWRRSIMHGTSARTLLVYIRIHIYTCEHVCVCMRVYIYIYIYIHIHIHIYIHTCTYLSYMYTHVHNIYVWIYILWCTYRHMPKSYLLGAGANVGSVSARDWGCFQGGLQRRIGVQFCTYTQGDFDLNSRTLKTFERSSTSIIWGCLDTYI